MSKRETRNKILNAAKELFSKEGYDGVTTKMIASLAGTTEMTLFNHFQNKELLYKTVIKENYLSSEVKSTFSILTYEELEKDLLIISKKIITNYIENKSILMMRLKEKQSFHNDKVFSIEQDPILIQLIPLFITYEKKELINLDGKKAATLFVSSLKGLFHISFLENKSVEDITSIITDFIHLFCYGVIKKEISK